MNDSPAYGLWILVILNSAIFIIYTGFNETLSARMVGIAAGGENVLFMKKLNLETEIGQGKDTEVNLLFDGARRKIMQITLRRNQVLKAHRAAEPITIQCLAGAGDLLDLSENEVFKLSPGVLVTVEPEVVHEVRASPEVSILLTKFKGDL